jgi:hypothetical protein
MIVTLISTGKMLQHNESSDNSPSGNKLFLKYMLIQVIDTKERLTTLDNVGYKTGNTFWFFDICNKCEKIPEVCTECFPM